MSNSTPDLLGFRGIRSIVTGAGSGIGRAIAIRLAANGANVVLVGRQLNPLLESADTAMKASLSGATCNVCVADLAEESSPIAIIEKAVSLMGGIDLLINNAAMLHRETEENEITDLGVWQAVMQTNLRAPYLLSKFAAPYLKQTQGAIVNLSSIWAHVGARKQVAYSTSKAAIVELTRSLALDFAADGIRVNCVCPSTTRTPLLNQGRSSFDERSVASVHPLARIGEPDDIASAVLFLGSKKAAGWITGSTLTADGGYTIQ